MTNYRLSKLSPLTQLPTSDENRPKMYFHNFVFSLKIFNQIFPKWKYDSAPYLCWESPSQWNFTIWCHNIQSNIFQIKIWLSSLTLMRIAVTMYFHNVVSKYTIKYTKYFNYKIRCQNIFPISYWSASFTFTDSFTCFSAFSYLSTVLLLGTFENISKHKKILERFWLHKNIQGIKIEISIEMIFSWR